MSDYRIEAATKEEWAERALRAEAKLAWQPIETAPKDTEILLTDMAFVHVGRFDAEADAEYPWRFLDWTSRKSEIGLNGWKHDIERGPTHWMPLPAPPSQN
jgi:hypothetical protein